MAYQAGAGERDAYDGEQSYTQRSRRRLYAVIIAMLVMTASGGAVWLFHREGAQRMGGEAPLIQADQRAVKVRPEQPGGMKIPNQDTMIYNPGRGSGQAERLLPPPEAPMARPVPPPPEPSVTAVPEPAAAPPSPAPEATPASAAALAAPVTPPAAAAPVVAPPPVAAAATVPAPAPAPSHATGGYRLQIGALRSEEAARKEWERLKHIHSDLLGGLTAATSRADLGDRGIYFRIQAGPIADASKAEKICNDLKRRNVGCILVRS
jgi:hypothetical protein